MRNMQLTIYQTWLLCLAWVQANYDVIRGEEHLWWRIVNQHPFSALNGHYTKYLEVNPSHREPISVAALRAHKECKRLFQSRRWNCTSGNPNKPYGNLMQIGCRETAFVYSINSAALVHGLIRACAEGRVAGCGNSCYMRENQQLLNRIPETRALNRTHFQHLNCDDNLRFGLKVWRSFVGAGERATDLRARFNMRNSRLGVQEVLRSSKLKCRCYGVSGSCQHQICSKKISQKFEEIGDGLFEHYTHARHVIPPQEDIEQRSQKRIKKMYKKRHGHDASDRELLKRDEGKTLLVMPDRLPRVRKSRTVDIPHMEFFDQSPDYCKYDSKFGTLGTTNRICDHIPGGDRSCKDLCCTDWRMRIANRTVHSNCRFVKLLDLQCDQSVEQYNQYFCS